ncbi:plasmid replication initiation protein, partial [Salmonella enterica subsp. enterica serovar Kentucky]
MWKHRRERAICKGGEMPLPRSLTRYARSFGCGERKGFSDRSMNFL